MGESPGAGSREASCDAVGLARYCPMHLWLKAAQGGEGCGTGTRDIPAELLEGGTMFCSSCCSWQELSKCGMTKTSGYRQPR